MAEHAAEQSVRPTSPKAAKGASRRERSRPNTQASNVVEGIELPTRVSRSGSKSQLPKSSPPSKAAADIARGNERPQSQRLASSGTIDSQNMRSLTFRKPRVQSHAETRDDDPKAHIRITLHDIIQSRWIVDPDDHALEKVYLTIEDAPFNEMTTIDTSFCWVHHQRDLHDMHFEDFVHILHKSPGLYPHEHDTALRCLEEVKNIRRVFAKGKYFEPDVHQVKQDVEVAGQKTEVKATFVSMPVFSSMRSTESHKHHRSYGPLRKPLQTVFEKLFKFATAEDYEKTQHHHLASKVLRSHSGHPIRSLMEHRNLLAVDHSRDFQQAVIKLEEDEDSGQPFIHVPEFWALIINMYTIITCAPFSVEQLQGDNIIFRQPPVKDRRMIVKYTNLTGALHDFRCRTWVGLLNIIARIENHIDRHEELAVLLQQENSEYQLVDSKFRRITRKRWISLTSSESASRSIFIRLLKVPTTDKVSVAYAEHIFLAERGYAWDIVTLKAEEIRLQEELVAARRRRHSLNRLMQIEVRLKSVRKQVDHATHIRNLRRLLLCVVRYHLIDPHGLLWAKDERWLRERTPPKPRPADDKQQTKASDEKSDNEAAVKTSSNAMAAQARDQLHHKIPGARHKDALVHGAIQELQKQGLARRKAVGDELYPSLGSQRDSKGTPNDLMDQILTTPQRSMTSKSLQLVRDPKMFSFRRSKTFAAKDVDVEAQIFPTQRAQRVTFAPTAQPSWRAPTYFIVDGARDRHVGLDAAVPQRQLAPAHIFRRRLSSSELRNVGPVTLSPRRLPLHIWQSQTSHRDTVNSQKGSAAQPSGLSIVTRLSVPAPTASASTSKEDAAGRPQHENNVRVHIRDVRKQKDMKRLRPFFLWKGATTMTPVTPRESNAGITSGGLHEEDEVTLNGSVSPIPDLESTKDLLDILNLGLEIDPYVSEDFPIRNEHYNTAKMSTIWEVADDLNRQSNARGPTDGTDDEEAVALLTTKSNIVLRVDAIIRCFVDEAYEGEAILAKVWGIVATLNELGLGDIMTTNQVFLKSHNEGLLDWTDVELTKIERLCREVLESARSDTGVDTEQLDLPLPPPFKTLFRDIVLFLLSVQMTAQNPVTYSGNVDLLRNKVAEDLTDSETALLRTARSLQDNVEGENHFTNESIKTADTILGLLLQNAFSISCSDSSADQKSAIDDVSPHCDLEHIYRRWTAVCHDHAMKEASAEMYEEVRLLHEELSVITSILEDQKSVFEKTIQLRESPKQNLDNRINKRIELHLQDMIKHFTTLKNYAKEAEILTTNYIRVRNEDNSKAIYIFTTVTVLFLPLSAVSSIFGMNTKDMRRMGSSSWLYWVIAVPVTFAVLVACLFLVRMRFKFKLRRHFGKMLLKLFPKNWGREHIAAKQSARGMPRQE